jgi:hypothetical protein
MNNQMQRFRNGYAKLLRLYPKAHYERFGEGMAQTFGDLLRERSAEGRPLSGYALWMFVETAAGIARERTKGVIVRNKNVVRLALATAFILLLPLLAMQRSSGVNWSPADVVVAGALLFGTGLMYELATRKADGMAYRAAVCMALSATFLLVWINLAVGMIGSEDNPANLIYGLVLAVGIIGAAMARLRPQGMGRTLFAMAATQALVAAIALMIGAFHAAGSDASLHILGVNALFVVLFSGSALLFLRAGAASPS